ncbi:MAG: biotin/lipoyl-binding protein [Idiomarina sp.]|nr:biotin/lipoyl-binding protein [Idiomarina sp.]
MPLIAACSESGDSESASNANTDGERVTPIAAYEVVHRDMSRQLNLSASVVTRISVSLSSRTQGLVAEVLVEEGDLVEAGDVLARFDVEEQGAELARAQARARETQLERERIEQLRESETVSVAELQRAQAAYEVAQAEQLLWQTRLDFGEIRAPQRGVIT